jgi:hypothetical protein
MPKPKFTKTIQLQPSLPCGLERCTTPLRPIPKQLPPSPQMQHLRCASCDYHSSCSSCRMVTLHKEYKHRLVHLRKLLLLLKFGLITVICLKYYALVQEIPYDRFCFLAVVDMLVVFRNNPND